MKKVIEICSICVSAYNQGGGTELTPVRSQHSATRRAGVLPVGIQPDFLKIICQMHLTARSKTQCHFAEHKIQQCDYMAAFSRYIYN